jgi:hypothetical protein
MFMTALQADLNSIIALKFVASYPCISRLTALQAKSREILQKSENNGK